uniref:Uncharacterized protein n=1 Tax=Echinococcus canadensis TaxID=519352 RepID=A0A915EVY3_9CEST
MGQCQVMVEEYFSKPKSSFKILLNFFKTPTARCKAWQSTRMFGCLLPPFCSSVSSSFPVVVKAQSISIVDSDNMKLLSVLATHLIPSLVEAVCNDGCSIQVEYCKIPRHMVPRFGEHLIPSYSNIPKCMLRALNSLQPALHKRSVQMGKKFISFEDTYTALLDFVSDI